ncbi:hypothetical protein [Mesorhizobium erdmanii]|uniref:hypothetical protein n=1 Tax=Mesorhizobium erdmanii TaxID=1777866 RepID=UPI000410CCAE|nr:hypothetical protein [Mesorhizobium erdmanii]
MAIYQFLKCYIPAKAGINSGLLYEQLLGKGEQVIVSGRILLGIVTLAALSGGVQASSLVFPDAPAKTPSILALKAAETRASDVVSVVALGEPDVTYEPDVTDEKVAAIPSAPEARHGFMRGPMIIRGGVVGGDFTPPTQAKAPAATTAAAPAPAQTTASAAPAPATQKKRAAPAAASPPAPGVGKVK